MRLRCGDVEPTEASARSGYACHYRRTAEAELAPCVCVLYVRVVVSGIRETQGAGYARAWRVPRRCGELSASWTLTVARSNLGWRLRRSSSAVRREVDRALETGPEVPTGPRCRLSELRQPGLLQARSANPVPGAVATRGSRVPTCEGDRGTSTPRERAGAGQTRRRRAAHGPQRRRRGSRQGRGWQQAGLGAAGLNSTTSPAAERTSGRRELGAGLARVGVVGAEFVGQDRDGGSRVPSGDGDGALRLGAPLLLKTAAGPSLATAVARRSERLGGGSSPPRTSN